MLPGPMIPANCSLRGHPVFAESVEDDRAADAEAAHGGEGHGLSETGAGGDPVGQQGGQSEENPQRIQPDGRVQAAVMIAQAQLQEQGN